jgi:hypothetical protein
LDATSKQATLAALREQVQAICTGNGRFQDVRDLDPRSQPAVPNEPIKPNGPHVSFGRWLLQQTGNGLVDGGFRAELLAYAMADRGFPREGSPEDVRARLRAVMADGDMFAAVDDAELDWACW